MIISETYPVAANDMSVAGDVSASIKRQMKRLGIPNQIMRRVAVCTYEAEINLVIHSDDLTFLMMLPLASMSTRSGMQPSTSRAFAAPYASAIGSVQPIAGTSSSRRILTKC